MRVFVLLAVILALFVIQNVMVQRMIIAVIAPAHSSWDAFTPALWPPVKGI